MFPDFLRNIVNFAGQVGICSLELQRVDPDQNPNIAIGLDRRCDCAGGAGADHVPLSGVTWTAASSTQ